MSKSRWEMRLSPERGMFAISARGGRDLTTAVMDNDLMAADRPHDPFVVVKTTNSWRTVSVSGAWHESAPSLTRLPTAGSSSVSTARPACSSETWTGSHRGPDPSLRRGPCPSQRPRSQGGRGPRRRDPGTPGFSRDIRHRRLARPGHRTGSPPAAGAGAACRRPGRVAVCTASRRPALERQPPSGRVRRWRADRSPVAPSGHRPERPRRARGPHPVAPAQDCNRLGLLGAWIAGGWPGEPRSAWSPSTTSQTRIGSATRATTRHRSQRPATSNDLPGGGTLPRVKIALNWKLADDPGVIAHVGSGTPVLPEPSLVELTFADDTTADETGPWTRLTFAHTGIPVIGKPIFEPSGPGRWPACRR